MTISSYINNLNPDKHKSMYPVLAGIFERFVPAFERVLSDLQVPPVHRNSFDHDLVYHWYDEAKANKPEEFDSWSDEETYYETRPVQLPEPEPFSMPETVQFEPVFPLNGRKLQVIVKLANIHLTPDKPEYPGGVWHVEVSSPAAPPCGSLTDLSSAHRACRTKRLSPAGSTISTRRTSARARSLSGEHSTVRGSLARCSKSNPLCLAEGRLYYEQNDSRGVREVYGIDSCVHLLSLRQLR